MLGKRQFYKVAFIHNKIFELNNYCVYGEFLIFFTDLTNCYPDARYHSRAGDKGKPEIITSHVFLDRDRSI